MRFPKIARNTILLAFGLAGLIHETVIRSGTERPVLIGSFLALCGLPAFLKADEKAISNQAKEELSEEDIQRARIEAAKQLIREGIEEDRKRGKYQ